MGSQLYITEKLIQLVFHFNAIQKGDQIDVDFFWAYISLILNPQKDPTDIANYRTILLINSDLKFLTKICATRLNNLIAQYIHIDRVGFLPHRQSADQVRLDLSITLCIGQWALKEGNATVPGHTQDL